MKKFFTLAAMAMIALSAAADEWTVPQYTGGYQPLTPGDTVYIYNTEAQAFLTEGNDWGTHATVGQEGLLFTVQTVEGQEGTYTIRDYSLTKAAWKNLFITDGGNIYVDYNSGGDIYFAFGDLGNNTYSIYGADANETWKPSADGQEGYLVGRYTLYENAQSSEATGTGVIYGAPVDGEFQTTWAFVSQADYQAYKARLEAYALAPELQSLIEQCEVLGIDVTAAQAVYDNTNSTVEEIQAAIDALNAAYLAYCQDIVTPENPLDLTKFVTNPTFDSTTGWSNDINATTYATGTWTGDNWEADAWTGNYLNIWGAAMQGTVSQTMTGLPEGIYNIQLSIYHEGGVVTFFANDNEKSVPNAQTSVQHYNIMTNVSEDGTLTFGVRQAEAATTWMTLDNAKLTYYGTGLEAYRAWINSLLESAPSFDEAVVQDSLVTEYNKVLASVDLAEDEEEIMAVIPAYQDILDKIEANMAAYTTLQETIAATQTAAESSTTYYKNATSAYITETAQPVYDQHTLGTEAVNAVTAQLTAYQTEMSSLESYYTQLMNAETKLQETYDASTSVEETKAEAEALMEELKNFDEDNSSLADYKTMIDRVNDMILLLSIPAEAASDTNPVDYTAKIKDSSFSNGATEWINEGWATCGYNSWTTPADGERFDENYLNLWNGNGGCRVYQQLAGLPNGTYTFGIYAFADAAGLEIYANTNDAVAVEATSGADAEGYYGHLYEVNTVVTDGTLEIGVRNVGNAVWAMVDNCILTYYGENSERIATAIEGVTTSDSKAVYNLRGQRVNRPNQRGIYIKNGKKVIY